MKRTKTGVLGVILVSLLLAGACTDGVEDVPLGGGPQVTGLSKQSVVIGETVEFYGNGFRGTDDREGVTRLTFQGTFQSDSGDSADVDFTFTPIYDGLLDNTRDVLRWSRFGPYENPFGMGTTGTFRGKVLATNINEDGTMVKGTSTRSFEMRVEPSIVIEKLEPLIADCGSPALRGLGGLPYQVEVRAIGFTPTRYVYHFTNVNNQDGEISIEHTASGPTDSVGWDEPVVLNPVPEDVMAYVTNVRIEAFDAKGQAVETALPFSVHRPMEFYYDGKLQVAEYFEPEPVTSCIPGSPGSRVTYSETMSETRQRSVSVTISTQWNQSQGSSNSSNWSEGVSEGITQSHTDAESVSLAESENTSESYGVSYNEASSNNVGFSSTDGETWGWDFSEGVTDEQSLQRAQELSGEVGLSVTATVGAEGSVPGFAKVSGSVATQGSVRVGTRVGNTLGERTAVSQNQGYSTGGRRDQSQTFGSTTTDSTGTNVNGSYAVTSTSNNTRSFNDTEARSESRTYNLGGSATENNVVSQGVTESEQQTWVESSTDSTLTSFSGIIPVNRFGVFYRQTVRLARKGQLRSYDLCGVSEVQGEMTFNEWSWAPALAIGDECGAVQPQSNLPQAECFSEPCLGR